MTLKLPTLLHRSLHKFKLFPPNGPYNFRYYVIHYFNRCMIYCFEIWNVMKHYTYTLCNVQYSGRHIVRHWNTRHVYLSKQLSNYTVRYFEHSKIFKLLRQKSLTLLSSSRSCWRDQQTHGRKHVTNKSYSDYRRGYKNCPKPILVHICLRTG